MKKLFFLLNLLCLCRLAAWEDVNLIRDPQFKSRFKYFSVTQAFKLETDKDKHRVLQISGVPQLGAGINSKQKLSQKIFETPAVLKGASIQLTFSAKVYRLTGKLAFCIIECDYLGKPTHYHLFQFAKKPELEKDPEWVQQEATYQLDKSVVNLYFSIIASGMDNKDLVQIDNISLLRTGEQKFTLPATGIPEKATGIKLK